MGKEHNEFNRNCRDIFNKLSLEISFQMIYYDVETAFNKVVDLKK